ncbi:MAG: pyridoxamine 5'-phosphate oxidase [Hyphomicrobiales bacterium]|jgi:pyridoxamine 5'-phosphate oxidase|nr:pyridoxamine 5'-phosphate oxidase [Hyphomicrobiales bacterium]
MIGKRTPKGEAASISGFEAVDEPLALFRAWLAEAEKSEPSEFNAAALATVDADGLPDARMVLLKGLDHGGFEFYTNLQSAKAAEIAGNSKAAMVFHWKSLNRQVRVRGPVKKVSAATADAYFATRHRTSQIGAWASKQSRELESRFVLEKEVAKFAAKFGLRTVPRPPHWGGYRILPLMIEFWRQRPFRLHDRLLFSRKNLKAPWQRTRLYP